VRSHARRQSATSAGSDGAGRLAATIARHPREFVGVVMFTAATAAIVVNALYLQHGPHPAPIFATRPLLAASEPVALPRLRAADPQPASEPKPVSEPSARTRVEIVSDIQRALAQRGFYDGAVDGVWGARTDTAARDFLSAAGLKLNPEAGDSLLRAITASNLKASPGRAAPEPARNDPIAALIAPSRRVLAVQRVLTDFGYGQIRPTGVADTDTQIAIEKFERDHQMPVTGEVSDRLVRELAAMTGRPLE
jgi:peptidoglycan hydrolase-like protein with peptidoglycan-binding domain